MAVAGDVPDRYDLVLNGQGYMYAEPEQLEATFGYTPTFITRQNVSGDYGDNSQEFWLTWTQRDWTLGEQQKFWRQSPEQARRFWQGTAVEVSTAGEVSLPNAVQSLTFAAAVAASSMDRNGPTQNQVAVATATNLYTVNSAGTITDQGAHGLGAAPAFYGMTSDGANVYLSTTGAGTVGIRKWTGAAFSTFSASGADSLAFLNNTLYGHRADAGHGDLVRWDTTGTISSLFTWKDAAGTAEARATVLFPYGGKLEILSPFPDRYGLYEYDGTGVALLAQFPADFIASDMESIYGVLFISGTFQKEKTGAFLERPCVFFYANGNFGMLWQANGYMTGAASGVFSRTPMATFGGRLLFADDNAATLMQYDPANGGISTIGAFTVTNTNSQLVASTAFALHTRSGTAGYLFPQKGVTATTGAVTSSLIDFDSGLTKLLRGVKVDWVAGSDGDGGSVDIAYRLNDLDSSSFTNLQTGAVSGTEYAFAPTTTGRAVSIKVTLNKGTSTNGPVLKRVALRAAPQQPTFKKQTYILYLVGRKGTNHAVTRDGLTAMVADALAQAQALRTAAVATTPVTITDEFSSYTGIIDLQGFELRRVKKDAYLAVVPCREV